MKYSFIEEEKPIAEINIIPFVDIILVLLIIFMVATPFLVKAGFSLQLPGANQAQKLPSSKINIVIRSDGHIILNNTPVTLQKLTDHLKKIPNISSQTHVVISADKNILHGKVIAVINAIQSAGLNQIAITTTYLPQSKTK